MTRVAATCLLLGLLSGCARRAPGPPECARFAARSLGFSAREIQTIPEAHKAYELRLTQCLTTPGYRAVLRCAEVEGDARRCEAAFERRQVRELR